MPIQILTIFLCLFTPLLEFPSQFMDETADRWWPEPDSTPPKPKSILVKLKVAKSRPHVCYFCNKEFSNGKALGGHIRIHMNQKSGLHYKKRIPVISDSASGLEEIGAAGADAENRNQKIVKCFLCNKEFGSEKSLFGHMRNHPGRGWRGIKPPNSEKTSCSSSVSENELAADVDDQMSCATAGVVPGTDLFKSFSKWSYVTASEETPPQSTDKEIPEAAYSLMLLSKSKDELRISRSRGKAVAKTEYEDEAEGLKLRGAEVAARMLDFDLNEPFVPSLNQV